jgi:hypothetical protein
LIDENNYKGSVMVHNELKENLYKICNEILTEIIEPTCNYCGIDVDYWMADIQMFTLDDQKLDEEILHKIQVRYNLKDEELLCIDTYTTLIQIALYIYMGDSRPSIPPFEREY